MYRLVRAHFRSLGRFGIGIKLDYHTTLIIDIHDTVPLE
jgi:hypothetical protein